MDLATLLSEHYNIKEGSLSIISFGSGLVNSTWKIVHNDQYYILQKVNSSIFKQPYLIDENINLIGNYLTLHAPEYIFTKPIQDIYGHSLINYKNEFFRLFDFVRNTTSYDIVTSADQAYQAAAQFGAFTSLLADFDSRQLNITIPDFHNLKLRYLQFNETMKKGNSKRIAQAHESIQKIISFYPLINTYDSILHQQWTPRVVHHDTKISNVLFVEGKGYCIIDLDTLMPGLYISDVGDMMRTYLPTVTENETDLTKLYIQPTYFEAIANGYLSKMKDSLNKEEMNAFVFSGQCIIYMQALRFCTDFLNNDVYYGITFEDQNLHRTKNQLKLLIEYERHVPEFKNIIRKLSPES